MRSMVVGCLGDRKGNKSWQSPVGCLSEKGGGQKGALPHPEEVPLASLSALRRAGDHAQHGGGMLERYEGE